MNNDMTNDAGDIQKRLNGAPFDTVTEYPNLGTLGELTFTLKDNQEYRISASSDLEKMELYAPVREKTSNTVYSPYEDGPWYSDVSDLTDVEFTDGCGAAYTGQQVPRGLLEIVDLNTSVVSCIINNIVDNVYDLHDNTDMELPDDWDSALYDDEKLHMLKLIIVQWLKISKVDVFHKVIDVKRMGVVINPVSDSICLA